MIPDNVKKQLLSKYLSTDGNKKLYKFLLTYALEKILDKNISVNSLSPELELLDLYDKCLILYRRGDDDNFLDIARICRKAAHKIYRLLIKKSLVEKNAKFLNLVG